MSGLCSLDEYISICFTKHVLFEGPNLSSNTVRQCDCHAFHTIYPSANLCVINKWLPVAISSFRLIDENVDYHSHQRHILLHQELSADSCFKSVSHLVLHATSPALSWCLVVLTCNPTITWLQGRHFIRDYHVIVDLWLYCELIRRALLYLFNETYFPQWHIIGINCFFVVLLFFISWVPCQFFHFAWTGIQVSDLQLPCSSRLPCLSWHCANAPSIFWTLPFHKMVSKLNQTDLS